MTKLIKVTFEEGGDRFSKVTADYSDTTSEILYLDNQSVKHFLRQALMKSQMSGAQLWT